MKTVRAEIRAIVDEAKRAGRPIHSMLIWGLLSRDIAQADFVQFMRGMVTGQQLVIVPAPPDFVWPQRGRPPSHYEPGPMPATTGRSADDAVPALMGFREHGRLMDARKAAQAWARMGRKAA